MNQDHIEKMGQIAGIVPEVSYSSFASYEVLIPTLLEQCRNVTFPLHLKEVDLAWNGVDGIASCIIGISQLADARNHRAFNTKVTGAFNLMSGIQLLVLTALVSPALPYAFVATAVNDFVLSLDPLIHAARRTWDFEYWLNDSFAQLNKLYQMIDELNQEIIILNNPADQSVIGLKNNRIQDIKIQCSELETSILCRLYCHGKEHHLTSNKSIECYLTEGATFSLEFKQNLKSVLEDNAITSDEGTYKAKDVEIHEQNLIELRRRSFNTTIFALSVIGWSLLCIPGMQVPAAIIIGITVALYLTKNTNALAQYMALESKPTQEEDPSGGKPAI